MDNTPVGPDDIDDIMASTPTEEPPDESDDDLDPTPAQFNELSTGPALAEANALSVLFDLALPVAIELGRTRMSVEEILALGRGSVIQLDRLAGEPIDVFVGDRRFAEGEVVVVGEQFGVRITQIIQKPTASDGEAA